MHHLAWVCGATLQFRRNYGLDDELLVDMRGSAGDPLATAGVVADPAAWLKPPVMEEILIWDVVP